MIGNIGWEQCKYCDVLMLGYKGKDEFVKTSFKKKTAKFFIKSVLIIIFNYVDKLSIFLYCKENKTY